MLDVFRDVDLEESEVLIKEQHRRQHAVGFSAEGAGFDTEGGAHACPEDGFADGQFPSEGAQVAFGTPVADEVQLQLFTAFEELLEAVDVVDAFQVSQEG